MSTPCSANRISLTWNAWNGDNCVDLTFPGSWQVSLYPMADGPAVEDDAIKKAFFKPWGTQRLRDLAANRTSIAVAVEDITRPAVLAPVLNQVMLELTKAGVAKNQVRFIICCGAHAPMSRHDLVKKLGKEILQDYQVYNHHTFDNLSETGITLGKTPVKLNADFLKADCRVLVGSIIPHSFAGFASGGKLVLPGLADIATLERTHKLIMMGFTGGINDVETNRFRKQIEAVAVKTGIDFFCGVVPNASRNIAGVFTGDVVTAHRKGVAFARQIYATEVAAPADVVVLNAYPKDTELLQADTALTPFKSSKSGIVKPGGTVVIISRCANGYGYHGLFGHGMRLSRKPSPKGMLQGRDLIFFSPGINQEEFNALYWNGYHFAGTWDEVIGCLKKKYPGKCSVSVFPCAPLQLVEEIHAGSSFS